MRKKLDETLDNLHEQLSSVENLDEEQVEMLRNTLDEIRHTLDKQEVSSASVADRMRDASQEFSGSHPVLTETIGRLADLLAQMGI